MTGFVIARLSPDHVRRVVTRKRQAAHQTVILSGCGCPDLDGRVRSEPNETRPYEPRGSRRGEGGGSRGPGGGRAEGGARNAPHHAERTLSTGKLPGTSGNDHEFHRRAVHGGQPC